MNKLDKNFVDRLPAKRRLMNLRAATLLFAVVALATVPAHAQDPGATVESLTSDLAALKARVAKLEGQVAAADLVGTYAFYGIQVELSGGPPARVSSYVYTGSVVLAADGTATLTGTAENGNTLSIGPSSSVSPFMGGGGGNGTFTWTYADGAVTFAAGLPALNVAAGGRVLVFAGANHSDGTNVLLILTRLQ